MKQSGTTPNEIACDLLSCDEKCKRKCNATSVVIDMGACIIHSDLQWCERKGVQIKGRIFLFHFIKVKEGMGFHYFKSYKLNKWFSYGWNTTHLNVLDPKRQGQIL